MPTLRLAAFCSLFSILVIAACTSGDSRPPHIQRVSPSPIHIPISTFGPTVLFDIAAGAGVATERMPTLTVNGIVMEATWEVVGERGFALLSSVDPIQVGPEKYVFQVQYWDTNGKEYTYEWTVTGPGGPDSPVGPIPTSTPAIQPSDAS